MSRLKKQVVCPKNSLTLNKGHDGSGIHCVNSNYYDTDLDERKNITWQFAELSRNHKIDKELYFYRGQHTRSLMNSIRYHLSRKVEFGK